MLNEVEREEIVKLQNRITLLEGFINYHWGEPWRKWQDAVELTKMKQHKVAGEPLSSGMTTRDTYVDAEG
jgi:hypothetical protein